MLREDYLKRLAKKRKTDRDEKGNVILPTKKRLAQQGKTNKMFGIDTPANAALTALTIVPGLGSLGLAAKVYKGMKAGKEVFKVGSKIYKSKTAAIEAAKKVVPRLKPKAKGNLSKEAKGRDLVARKEAQKKDTPKFRRDTGTDVKNQSKAQLAAKIGAEKNAVKATGLGLTSLIASRAKNTDMTPPKKSKKLKNTKQEFAKAVANRPTTESKVKTKPIAMSKKKKSPARSIKDAKKRGLSTFTNKAGKKLAAVTKEQLDKSGLSLRDYLNKKEGLTRKKPTTKKMGGGKVYRRGGGRALRGMGKAIYSNKMY